MTTRCVLLLSTHPLLSEGLVKLLGDKEDVAIVGPLPLETFASAELAQYTPDLVLVAEQDASDSAANKRLLALLNACPDVPIVQVGLSDGSNLRVYTARMLPARSADLLNMIRSLPLRPLGTDQATTCE